MKRNILIVVAVILALVLIGEVIYLVHRHNANDAKLPEESTNNAAQVSTDEPGTSQTTTAGEAVVSPAETQPGSESDNTDPPETTDPTETTAPEETKTQSSVEDEDDLPPQLL